jgi:diadenosine tetraphosphate (Ap4A) HIT family hydrolase
MTEDRELDQEDQSFEVQKHCPFCTMMISQDPDRIHVSDSGQATAVMSKKDGHPLVIPYRHVTGEEEDRISYMAMMEAWEWANSIFPYVAQAYRDLHGATGFTLKVNTGTQQNIKHYHIHIEAWRGEKDQEQIVMNERADREMFGQRVRELMDPERLLANMPLEPTHQ